MAWRDWLGNPATATTATIATDTDQQNLTVAEVATVAVAKDSRVKSDVRYEREAEEERAAIYEYEAGLSRQEAERRAGIR